MTSDRTLMFLEAAEAGQVVARQLAANAAPVTRAAARLKATPPDLLLMIDVDGGDGAWRTAGGGATGEDWISLGAFCWRVARGAAAARLAQISGYRRLPRVGDIGR